MKTTILSLIISFILLPTLLAYRSQPEQSSYYKRPTATTATKKPRIPRRRPQRPYPKFRKPIKQCHIKKQCACQSYYKLSGARIPYYDHELKAAQEGCHLATASSPKELEAIVKIARVAALTVGGALAYIGACRASDVDIEVASFGGRHGPWKWCGDGCTPYKFSIFSPGYPTNVAVNTVAGVSLVDDMDDPMNQDPFVPEFLLGDIRDTVPTEQYAAVYECCKDSSKAKKSY